MSLFGDNRKPYAIRRATTYFHGDQGIYHHSFIFFRTFGHLSSSIGPIDYELYPPPLLFIASYIWAEHYM